MVRVMRGVLITGRRAANAQDVEQRQFAFRAAFFQQVMAGNATRGNNVWQTFYRTKRVLPVPRSIRPIRFARNTDMARFAFRSETAATMPIPMLKT
jgi:hypothetical protein